MRTTFFRCKIHVFLSYFHFRLGHQDPGEFPEEVKALFEKAVQYYEENMVLMEEISDRAAQGRACGNLGNVHYLLGNFAKAIHYHLERLKIAKEFGDRAAERRAHSNLGNAHIFLGEFEKAAEHYKKTLILAQELGDRAVEAQACYSLGNTYTLLKDYETAIEYHLRHLRIAQELFDKVGEGRACWSLGNAHSAMGQHKDAFQYASKHLQISKETGDRMGQATAQLNIAELSKTLGYPASRENNAAAGGEKPTPTSPATDSRASRRISMERMDLLKMTPDAKGHAQKNRINQQQQQQQQQQLKNGDNIDAHNRSGAADDGIHNKSGLLDEEDFFDFISRFQSKRMDDQRCSMAVPAPPPSTSSGAAAALPPNGNGGSSGAKDDLMDMIAGVQGGRMEEQRATVSFLPGLTKSKQPEILQRLSVATNNDQSLPDENFFDMLMKCQGSRIEDQRSSLPLEGEPLQPHAPTVPDEDFFSLIQKIQGGRLEDQRAVLKTKEENSKQ